jgi:hypothetical protein
VAPSLKNLLKRRLKENLSPAPSPERLWRVGDFPSPQGGER